MADIGDKLNELLSSPDGMQKLQQAAGQLQGILGDDADMGALLSKLAPPEKSAPKKTEGIDLSLLTKAAPFLQAMQQEDDSSNLLKALRPYLHGERQKKLDDAIQILKWLRLATLLKEQGVL
jgi:hypothetical protein